MNFIYSFLFILLLSCSTLSQPCPPVDSNDLFQSGNVAMANNRVPNARQHCYSIPVNYPVPSTGFQLAISTSLIQSYNPAGGFDYSVRGGRRDGSPTLSLVLMIDNDHKWRTLKISYLVSSRNEIILGSFVGDTFYVIGCSVNQDGKTSLSTYVPKWRLNENNQYKVAAYISGLRTQDSSFSVSILATNIEKNDGRLVVQIQTNAKPPLEIIHISYIVYPTEHDHFSFSEITNPTGQGTYELPGCKGYNQRTINYDEFKICKKGTVCPINQVTTPTGQCQCRQQYVRVGQTCKRLCAMNAYITDQFTCVCVPGFRQGSNGCVATSTNNCPRQNEQWNGSSCVCQQGYDRNQNGICVARLTCSNNQVLQGTVCVCRTGFSKNNNGVCVQTTVSQCPLNEVVSTNGQCICRVGMIRVNQRCENQCAIQAYFNPQRGCICVPGHSRQNGVCKKDVVNPCGSNEVVTNGECACRRGFIKANQKCEIQCGPNAYINPQRRCVCVPGYSIQNGACKKNVVNPCGSNEVFTNGECTCRKGFIKVNEKCEIQCRPNGYANSQRRCVCIPGYVLRNNVCSENVISCGQNQVAVNGQCQCQSGYFLEPVFNICFKIPDCPENKQWSVNRCVCKSGYKEQGVDCVINSPCSETEVFSNGFCQCKPQHARNSQNICVLTQCTGNRVWGGSSCVCKSGFTLFPDGSCQIFQCTKPNQVTVNGQCLCKNGYRRDNNQNCVLICQENEVLRNNVCDCDDDFQRDASNKCVPKPKCGENQVLLNNVCECKQGYIRSSNNNCIKPPVCGLNQILSPQTLQCECEPGYLKLGPTCVSKCRINQEYINDQCVCIQNHAWVNGACRPCPVSSTPNNEKTTCICNGGKLFKKDTQQCEECSPNSSLNAQGNECVCDQGYTWNNDQTACILVQNCPANSANQGGICRCNVNYYDDNGVCKPVPRCPERSNWSQNTLSCVCTNSEEHIINGKCQRCSQNEIWNQGKCQCQPQFFQIGGNCVTCDPHTTYNGQDCICNIGYFGNRNSCQPCHSTCGTCSGSDASQCITCRDITYKLQSGYCSRDSPCLPGFYSDTETQICERCNDFCQQCQNMQECKACSLGFKLQTIELGGFSAIFCEPICGDGKRNVGEDCDDGNMANGDGCSNICKEQSGWSCTGGTSIQVSQCTNETQKSIFEEKGAVFYLGKVIQSINMKYIPDCFKVNDCAECYKILTARVYQSNIQPKTVVNFVPLSKYQFSIDIDFGGTYISSAFTLIVEINKELPDKFDGCFTEEEMAQQLKIDIDPALLIINEEEEELNIDNLFGGF